MSQSRWNKHSKLIAIWAVLNIIYFGSAVLCFLFAFLWRGLGRTGDQADDRLLRRFAVPEVYGIAAVNLGSTITVNVLSSCSAFLIARREGGSTKPYSIFNASLAAVIMGTATLGSIIWFWSLRETEEYASVFRELDPAIQGFVQDTLQCCGYYNATVEGMFTSSTGFCSTVLSDSLNTTQGCMRPLIKYSDRTLNTIFTTVYGIVGVQCALFLATACLRVDKLEEERFLKIDEKSRSRGSLP